MGLRNAHLVDPKVMHIVLIVAIAFQEVMEIISDRQASAVDQDSPLGIDWTPGIRQRNIVGPSLRVEGLYLARDRIGWVRCTMQDYKSYLLFCEIQLLVFVCQNNFVGHVRPEYLVHVLDGKAEPFR